MRVKKLTINNLTKHASTEVEFPEAGLVVVTGPNGSGKSTLIEAVSVCMWGKSLRGTDLWGEGSGAVVLEDFDGTKFVRKRSKSGKTTLKVDGGPDFQTAKGAKRALSGDFKRWQRSCVFSFEDVVGFTRASDAERKRMLEGILSLDRFENALKECREDRKSADEKLKDIRHKLSLLETELASSQRFRGGLLESLEGYRSQGSSEDLERSLEEDNASLEQLRTEEASHSEQANRLRGESTTLYSEISALKSQLASEGDSECRACGRPLDAYRPDVVADLEDQIESLQAKHQEIVAKGKAIVAKEQALRKQASSLVSSIATSKSKLQVLLEAAPKKAKAEQKLVELNEELDRLQSSITEAQEELMAYENEKAAIDSTEKVLGVKGLRAHVLTEALTGLEDASNYWLERFSPGVSVRIKPQRELKSGATSDEIGVEFEGVAAGNGYKGSSRGERRRQDVAITWALGEIEAAANGHAESTIFCDEPFDALDPEGVHALVSALDEVRQRRCVVIISHSSSLVGALRPDYHYAVDDGVVIRKK